MNPKEMTGLQLLEAMCTGKIPPANISETIPMLEAGVGYGTIDLNIKMCRPIPRDKELLAIGSVINISKNLGISEGKILDEDGKLYAHATATCMIIRP